MTRRRWLRSDPELAKPHEAGATITVFQPLEHKRLGSIGYIWPRFWVFHLNVARSARDELERLHGAVERIPVDASNMRMLDAGGPLPVVYEAGVNMVLHAVLAIQHVVREIERTTGTDCLEPDVLGRWREAAGVAEITDPAENAGYAGVVALVGMRNAVEHPTEANTYSAHDWDQVPLAWMLSEQALIAFDRFEDVFCDFVDRWLERSKELARPGTLTGVERGIRSARQFKKPPPVPPDEA